ncbi:MAG: hypothetical protein M1834_004815 [Cirrosporium novae-zelandiae]|nr:MAG: hypothetical protein M1834_004815 [Cirrosporium novae-zelandiae]
MSAINSSKNNPCFQLLEYCQTNWHYHYRNVSMHDNTRVSGLTKLMLKANLPFQWQPWDPSNDLDPFPHWSMFNWAVRQGHGLIFQTWKDITSESDVNGSWELLLSSDGDHLFCSASTMRNVEQLNILLQGRAALKSSKMIDMKGASVGIVVAGALGHIEMVEQLLQEDVNANSVGTYYPYNKTALQAAAENGHLAVVEYLVQKGADIEGNCCEISIPLIWSGKKRDIIYNSNTQYGQQTTLQFAAENGHLAVVEYLVQKGAKIESGPRYGKRTALTIAQEGGHQDIVEVLSEAMREKDINQANQAQRLDDYILTVFVSVKPDMTFNFSSTFINKTNFSDYPEREKADRFIKMVRIFDDVGCYRGWTRVKFAEDLQNGLLRNYDGLGIMSQTSP